MLRVTIPRSGPPSVMVLREHPDPEPGAGEVRIRVEAAGVCFADLMIRMGLYPEAPPFPVVPGYEVAGVIDAVGEGVDASRVGAPVVALTLFGGYSTHVVVPDAHALTRPARLDAVTAAAMPVNGLTAWMLTQQLFRVRAGDRVLVPSAGGGVGLAVLDLVRWKEGTAMGVASLAKHAFLLERGFAHVVDRNARDWKQVVEAAGPFDLVLDSVGGRSVSHSFDLVAGGGMLICYGYQSVAASSKRKLWPALKAMVELPWLRFNPLALADTNRAVAGVNMLKLATDAVRVRAWMTELLALWESGIFRPYVHATVPFSRAEEAHGLLHDRKNVGKVVLVPDP
ncbi:MAG: zinc-binding dehydrogenase [Deltaproteobacteria bacterium]|nr:zinc-binding dehydrogenase [Deltaproteobacteria bacterium]